MVEIDVRDIIHPQLSYIIKDSGEVYQQNTLMADFTAIIDTVEVVFRVIRGGVDQLSDSAANFLTQNFLTWQPSVKPVTYYSPEFLTYYAVESGKIKLHAYFTDDKGNVTTEQELVIVDIIPGIAYTIPLQYSVVAGWLNSKLPAYYDVWAENVDRHRLTYIQRYYAENMRSTQEQWVLFENSLGGLDTFRAYGSDQLNAEHTHNLAEIDEVAQEYRVDTERKHLKNTGYLNKEEARWLLDFFPSQKKYLYTGNYLRQIVVMESNVTGKLQEAPVSYTFTYKYADARPLLNLPRTDVPADVLDITIPEVGSFTVPPRLAEVPRLPLTEGALFPVQNPYSEEWGTTTAGMIGNFISKIFAVYKFFKGYFSISQSLISKFPNPQEGWYAFVGTPWPGTVYECSHAGIWENTGVAPLIGEDIFIELLKRHIDGTTIYWDDTHKVIKSHGGSGDAAYVITVSINSADIGRCAVSAIGEVVSTSLSNDGSTYTILAAAGGTVKIQILPETGYQVQKLDVDTVSQGAVSEYTFEKLDADHNMYVWMELSEEIPTEFLTRSDLPGMYYSGTQSVFDALKSDYPDGLTQDVTITCVKPAKEKRLSGALIAELSHWNRGSMHTLTLEGAGRLVYDGQSLGGLQFDGVDNVVLSNISFVNYSNYAGASSPSEVYAVNFIGDSGRYARNLLIQGCTFNGAWPADTSRKSWRTIGSKYSENLTVAGCDISNEYGNCMKLSDSLYVSLIKNTVHMDYSLNVVAHPSVVTMKNGYALNVEDNRLSGDCRENYLEVSNVDRVYIRRNSFTGGGGRAVTMSALKSMKEVVIESNLFAGMVNAPAGAWMKEYINPGAIDKLSVCNNTFYMSGAFYEQYALRGGVVRDAGIYNNILVNATKRSTNSINGFVINKAVRITSGSNLYAGMRALLVSPNTDKEPDYITLDYTIGKNLAGLQAAGYERASAALAEDTAVLDGSYRVLPEADASYKADDTKVPSADAGYREKAASGNSRGCYNLAGTAIDEDSHVTGYTGEDYGAGRNFSSASVYSVMAGDTLCLRHNTLNRLARIIFSVTGTQHRELLIGRSGIIHPMPGLDANGEYLADESYTVTID